MNMRVSVFVKRAVKAIMPYGIVMLHRRNKEKKAIRVLYGNDYCPVCEKTSCFVPFGIVPRPKACCPHCRSLERHRLLWLFWQKKTSLFNTIPKKILHVAAEPCFESRFKKLFGSGYLTADLYNPNAMVKMDITDIGYPDESFDIIICNHVLEHVPDDIKAMSEFYRVLKHNGWAVLLVPIANLDKTYEDFSITTESGRLEAFGQGDHVRKYGRDYLDRLKSVGFNITVVGSRELASAEEIAKMNVDREIFYCTKQAWLNAAVSRRIGSTSRTGALCYRLIR